MRDPWDNQRQYTRYQLQSMVKIKLGPTVVIGELNTISLGGVSFKLNYPIVEGRNVNLILTSPNGRERLDLTGRIVWSLDQKSYGVQFFPVGNVIADCIRRWTENLIAL